MSKLGETIRFLNFAIDDYKKRRDMYSFKRIIRHILENKDIYEEYVK